VTLGVLEDISAHLVYGPISRQKLLVLSHELQSL